MCISHLQFVDDTLIVGRKSWVNIRAIKVNLILFEIILSLKVNFHKRLLMGVNVAGSWLVEVSVVLNCKFGHIVFLYHDIVVGGDCRPIRFWSLVLQWLGIS